MNTLYKSIRNNTMKPILAVALSLFFVAQAYASSTDRKIFVFGDSLSAPYFSWAEVIDQANYAQVHNYSRGGLKMVDLTFPNWLACDMNIPRPWKPDTVILWLGTNDIYNKVDYEDALRAAVASSMAQGCMTYVVMPQEGLDEHRELFTEVVGDFPGAVLVDMPWDKTLTVDGIHQTQMLHWIQAAHMIKLLELTPLKK